MSRVKPMGVVATAFAAALGIAWGCGGADTTSAGNAAAPGGPGTRSGDAIVDRFAALVDSFAGRTSPAGEQSAAQTSGDGGDRQDLVDYYLENSMLQQSERYAQEVMADPSQWRQYINPEPQEFKDTAGEFLTIYPRSILTPEGSTVFETLANTDLWAALEQIGITLMHPVAFEQAGWVREREIMPSVDGGFDRISFEIEPGMGDADDVRMLSRVAQDHGALVAGDIIPLHLGLGFDFRLAQMGVGDYPGAFDMIEVPEEHWGLLPAVDDEWGFEVILEQDAQPLIDLGIMPGRFDPLLGAEESTTWSGWAATGAVTGVDGKTRRFIYAHLFKPEQPVLNWMDPTYAARRLQAGDVARHILDLGVQVDRLDAVPFLAFNPVPDGDTLNYYNLQLAISGTEDLAYLHRKFGGWTWVELNVPVQDFLPYMEHGPELGYDFFTRAQTVHPLITGDARVLRIAHRTMKQAGIDQSRLIHALQNHDEIAYQLINLRAQETVMLGDEEISGSELADRIEQQMHEGVAPPKAPYNALYRPAENGIATTYAGFIAPALGINPYEASSEQVDTIKNAHVMLAQISAMQPGVFAISQWDLVGALPVDRSQIQERIQAGDLRWLNRGAVDLMGVSDSDTSVFGIPEPPALYGPLPEQLENPDSFASRVAKIVDARKRYGIADAEVVEISEPESNAIFALVMKLPDDVGGYAVTAANYEQEGMQVEIDLSAIEGGVSGTPRAIVADEERGELSGDTLSFQLDGLEAVTIAIGANPGRPGNGEDGGGSGSGSGSP